MKTIQIFCLLALMLSTSIASNAVTVGDLNYTTNSSGTASVTGLANSSVTEIIIPETITVDNKEYIVTTISASAFSRKSNITSVIIGNSVTSIGNNAFQNCTSLTSIHIPDAVTSIGDVAFYECAGLTSIHIPDAVTSIGSSAFSGCSGLTSIHIPDAVTSIGSSAFYGCNFSKVIIPENVNSIGLNAFAKCSSLKEFIIEDSEKSLTMPSAREYTSTGSSNSSVLTNSVTSNSPIERLYIGRSLSYGISYDYMYDNRGYYYHYYCSPFANNPNLKEVSFGNNVKSIYDYFLFNCKNLDKIFISGEKTISGKALFIGHDSRIDYTSDYTSAINTGFIVLDSNSFVPYCFDKTNMTAFLYVSVPEELVEQYKNDPNWSKYSVEAIKDKAWVIDDLWYGMDTENKTAEVSYNLQTSLDNYKGIENVIIPENYEIVNTVYTVTGIHDKAFDHCWTLKSIEIPETVTSIGQSAFGYCTSLRSVNIPSSVTTIGNDAFTGCSGLAELTLNEGLEKIGDYAFFGCTGLDQISIPRTVETIGERAFMGMHWLNDVYVNSIIPSEAPINAFTETAYKNATLHVPAGTLNNYRVHPTWSKFLRIEQEDDIITDITAVEADTEQTTEVYTLSGVRVSNVDSLAPGIYIVKCGNVTRKVVVK